MEWYHVMLITIFVSAVICFACILADILADVERQMSHWDDDDKEGGYNG